MDDYAARLLAKLAPESVNRTLIRAGCFLSAYELIKAEVVDSVHEFFARDFRDGKFICDEARYQQDVLNRNLKSKYRASCAWLVEMGALTSIVQGSWGPVTDSAAARFRVWCLFDFGGRVCAAARCARVAPAPTAPGWSSFRVDGVVRAGQAGAGRAHSRCQQVRNACFQGQPGLILRTRSRAWRASRAGMCQIR